MEKWKNLYGKVQEFIWLNRLFDFNCILSIVFQVQFLGCPGKPNFQFHILSVRGWLYIYIYIFIHPILSCPVLSSPVLSYPIPSYPIHLSVILDLFSIDLHWIHDLQLIYSTLPKKRVLNHPSRRIGAASSCGTMPMSSQESHLRLDWIRILMREFTKKNMTRT